MDGEKKIVLQLGLGHRDCAASRSSALPPTVSGNLRVVQDPYPGPSAVSRPGYLRPVPEGARFLHACSADRCGLQARCSLIQIPDHPHPGRRAMACGPNLSGAHE
ncbi:hypothetical protein C8R44DRAFT_786226 [Mycena epipterygia]|nr:hypothetical protein C8R44DRAFT_786226 [Mycena epipterygia]